ncbi:MAG: histidine phosphatase family protein [Micrococcales bacterium]|nr:histidine phosphatase family protein [Micrococcales bacterium]
MVDAPELRILVLLRHAQAKGSSSEGDLGRELTASGRRTAAAVGEWLLAQGVRPDAVVISPSTRTRQTWEGLRRGGLEAQDVYSDAALYDADPQDIVESIHAVPEDVSTLVVIGHAPGVPALALNLADHLPQQQEARPAHGWPPAAVAVVGHPGSWAQFPGEDTAIVAFHRP